MNIIKEKLLVSRVRKDDSEAFREIYRIFADRIYRFIFFRLPNESDCQDLMQEAFIRVWGYLKNKDKEIKSLQALIYKITKNLIADYYRDRNAEAINIEEVA